MRHSCLPLAGDACCMLQWSMKDGGACVCAQALVCSCTVMWHAVSWHASGACQLVNKHSSCMRTV